jgi:hypothetical protein
VDGLQFGCFEAAEVIQVYLHVLEMRFVIRSGVKSHDLHGRFVGESVPKSKAEELAAKGAK